MSKKQLQHIAFIMDGNGRYAKALNKKRTYGHLQGAKRIPEIILACKQHNIPYISFFAFSTENWSRNKSEVQYLMDLLNKHLSNKTVKWFKEHELNLNVIGFEDKLKPSLFKKIKKMNEEINQYDFSTKVNIFFNYGSRQEIIYAINQLVKNNLAINEQNFNLCLLTNNLPDVDLLIRTSGEKRISNFLLWQIAYSEIIFEEKKWPEYTKEVLEQNIIEYDKRDRRFGKEE